MKYSRPTRHLTSELTTFMIELDLQVTRKELESKSDEELGKELRSILTGIDYEKTPGNHITTYQ